MVDVAENQTKPSPDIDPVEYLWRKFKSSGQLKDSIVIRIS